MLNAIMLNGFRCFAEPTRVTFGHLTVLAGANSAGKSSVLHTLLSFVQSQQQQPSAGLIRLSGEWVEMGSFQQVLSYSRQGERRCFTIGISSRIDDEDTDMLLTLVDPGESSRDTAKIERIEASFSDREWVLEPVVTSFGVGYRMLSRTEPELPWQEGLHTTGFPWHLDVRGEPRDATGFHKSGLIPYGPTSTLYLSACRDLPRKFYPRRSSELGPLLGTMGEYVAETLFTRRNATVDVLPKEGPPRLLGAALEAWWSQIFGGDYGIRTEDAGEDLGFTLSLDLLELIR